MTAPALIDGAPSAVALHAVWRVLPGAYVLLGSARSELSASGAAQHAAGVRGAFRAVSWRTEASDRSFTFLAAMRLPGRAELAPGAALALRGVGGERLALTTPSALAGDAVFGQHVAQLAGAQRVAVARFLLETLRPPSDEAPGADTMLRAFLSQATQPDGCIEIMTAVPDGCVVLQGWGARVAGPVQVVLAAQTLPCFAGFAGEFARPDISAPSTGVLLALPHAASASLVGVDHVFVLSDAGLHSRTLVEHRLLDPVESVGHIRHMLPALRCPPPMQALLRTALRPRYDGRDTLSGNAHPVRAAIDFAAVAPGAGAFLAGWMFDPGRNVAELHLCGDRGTSARIDKLWQKISREDVSNAFRNEPGFPKPPDSEAGFAAFVPADVANGEAFHLQFTFTDGDRAFLPMPTDNAADPAVRTRLLGSVDLYKPSGLPIIERHLAPLLARVTPASPGPSAMLLAGPTERVCAIVVPLAASILPRTLLSSFLRDVPDEAEQIVLVCGPEWTEPALDRLRGLLQFYRLPATLLVQSETAGSISALREAALHTGAEQFLLAGPSTAGRTPGWRAALRAVFEQSPGAAFACPTLLYEDWSIRYAGAVTFRVHEGAPYAEAHAGLAGLPAALAIGDATTPGETGTLECCLLGRAALMALDGPGALTTEPGQEASFFRRLRAAGIAGVWAPGVQVYAPESGQDEATSRVARLVDGWMLRDACRRAGEV